MKPEKQAQTLKKIVGREERINYPKVLTITSGKGGVGKTNIVANLACALQKRERKVLVFDADMGLGNIHILLGLAPKINLQHVLSGEKTIEEIVVEGPSGLNILPATTGEQELTKLGKEDRLLLLEELDRVCGSYDFLIFDTGAGISSNVTYFCSAAHEIILIVTTEITSLTDAYGLMKVLNQKHGQNDFRLILNTVRSEKEALEIFRHLTEVVDKFLPGVMVDYMGYILIDENVRKAVRQQASFLELYPHSKISHCINDLADKIVIENRLNTGDSKHPFFWSNLLSVQ